VYRPIAGSVGFLDGFVEERADGTVGASSSAFGHDASTLPGTARQEIVRLVGEDGGHSRAIHYTIAGERTAVLATHPRADVSSHYLVPALLDAGFAVLALQSRYFNNDEDCLHEALLADVAAATRFLRVRGYENVVLLGNSGGGSLLSFYQAMAQTLPPGRPTHTPGGTDYDLNGLDLPPADGLLLLAAHLGEGRFLMNVIDPSVTDENDPLSCDPALDMYDPANGFRPLPGQSRYTPGFVDEYRAAQRARVARIDALAHQQIAQNRRFAELVRADEFAALPLRQQIDLQRRAEVGRYLLIARTDADPASLDLSLHPSARPVGSLQGPRPDLQNYRLGYHGHCMTPEGWLSTWSGLSSRAALAETVAHVTVPTVVINYSADAAVFPEHAEAVHKASGADDKVLHHVDGDHYGVGASGKARATTKVLDWLRERYPTAR
jgi:esterase/lipase